MQRRRSLRERPQSPASFIVEATSVDRPTAVLVLRQCHGDAHRAIAALSSPAEDAAAPPPAATARRGRRRTTAARANRFGRNELPIDLPIDILEVIFELLEPRDLTTLLRVSKSWYGMRADMHSWLRKKFIELDKRVRARFKPLPPKTIMQTPDGPLWPHDCSCQPRNTIEPRYDGNMDLSLIHI